MSCPEGVKQGRFTNSVVRKVAGGFQVAPAERPSHGDIQLSSAWHPDMLRAILVGSPGPRGRARDLKIVPEFSSHMGPSMPGVLPTS